MNMSPRTSEAWLECTWQLMSETEPPFTRIPPPCKQGAKREFPIGAMGTFERECAHNKLNSHRWYTMRWSLCLPLHRHRRPANNEQIVSLPSGRSFPIGAMGNFRSLWHVHSVVDQSMGRSCASVSRGKHVSKFPIGAMGSLQAWLARTYP